MRSWNDYQLGTFTFEEYQWKRSMEMEAFSIFTYRGFADPDESMNNSTVEIGIDAEDENDIPIEEVVKVARLTIENHNLLLKNGIKALFNDLKGGLDSGMWWHASIDHVREIVARQVNDPGLAKLEQAEDLHALLGSPRIRIQEFGYGYDRPCSVISFESVFEIEHGIGILTDGYNVLGVGYEMDVSPFGS